MLLGSYYDTVTLFCVCCLVIMLTFLRGEGKDNGRKTKSCGRPMTSANPPTLPPSQGMPSGTDRSKERN